jgi:energy-coupling factor transport system ATP-binding protein
MYNAGIDTKEPIIWVKDLWLRYRSSQNNWVLRSLNLVVQNGEVVLIVGASGSGKTSLVRALTGVAQALFNAEVRGEIKICFRNLSELNAYEIQRCIQVVNQDPYTHFLDPIPLDDMLSYAEKFYGNDADEVVKKVVKILGIENIVSKPTVALSGGQLRKVAIAKVLIPNPAVLVFDEPLMWLDDATGLEMFRAMLKTLKGMKKTVIIVEHRFLRLLDLVDSVYKLSQGSLVNVSKNLTARLMQSDGNRNGEKRSDSKASNELCKEVLRLSDVWFKYGDSDWILKGVNLRVCQGDTIIVYGSNGAGKSTLLKIIAGVLKPTKGYVEKSSRFVYVPQVPYLFLTEESIEKEVKELCSIKKTKELCFSKGIEFLKKFGYDDLDKLPLHLSWGQMTRLATLLSIIAIGNSGVALLDEPFTGSTYIEAVALVETLNRFTDVAKVIALSSKDYIPLFPNAKIYVLSSGMLKTFIHEKHFEFSRALYELISP